MDNDILPEIEKLLLDDKPEIFHVMENQEVVVDEGRQRFASLFTAPPKEREAYRRIATEGNLHDIDEDEFKKFNSSLFSQWRETKAQRARETALTTVKRSVNTGARVGSIIGVIGPVANSMETSEDYDPDSNNEQPSFVLSVNVRLDSSPRDLNAPSPGIYFCGVSVCLCVSLISDL